MVFFCLFLVSGFKVVLVVWLVWFSLLFSKIGWIGIVLLRCLCVWLVFWLCVCFVCCFCVGCCVVWRSWLLLVCWGCWWRLWGIWILWVGIICFWVRYDGVGVVGFFGCVGECGVDGVFGCLVVWLCGVEVCFVGCYWGVGCVVGFG